MVTISQERAKLAAVGLKLRTREQTGFRFDYTTARTVNEPATKQVVHITITNPENYNSDDAHARAVEAIGISRFPSTGVSYNRLFMRSGVAYEAQPMGRRGAHTVNDFHRATCTTTGCPTKGSSLQAPDWNLNYNARSYVICQNLQHTVTDKQLDAIARAMAADRLAGLVTRDASIHGHRCCSSKDCPGDKMWALMGRLEALVLHSLQVGLEDGMSAEEVKAIKDHIDARFNALVAAVDGVDESVWATQIADVFTPEAGDTSAAATLLTHTAVRTVQRVLQDVQPQIVSDIVTNLRQWLPKDIEAEVLQDIVNGVWNKQIADVYTPESGDTAAAASLLTYTANRIIKELKPEEPTP